MVFVGCWLVWVCSLVIIEIGTLKLFGFLFLFMTGVSVSGDGGELVTSYDVREVLGDRVDEIEEFVEFDGGYGEFELFEGVYLIMDWEVGGLDDTFVLVDCDEVGVWYESPEGHMVTRYKTEVMEVSERVGWAMEVFRDDVTVHTVLEEDSGIDRVRVSVDNSGRVAPRLLTKLLKSLEGVGVDSVLEYSSSNSGSGVDVWV